MEIEEGEPSEGVCPLPFSDFTSTRFRLNGLAEQLPKNQFVRISRSHSVSLDRIKEMRSKCHGDYLILLHDGTRLTVSRTYRQNLAPLLGNSR